MAAGVPVEIKKTIESAYRKPINTKIILTNAYDWKKLCTSLTTRDKIIHGSIQTDIKDICLELKTFAFSKFL